MNAESLHQCLIYEGSPSRYLPALAAALKQKLNAGYRCLYLNSPAMVAGMRSYLAAEDVDIVHYVENATLVLTSEQQHLINGHFNVDKLMDTLKYALDQALLDGYSGLWATGDMTWELGPHQDFSKLLEYEWRLEGFLRANPSMSGVCQYHADTLGRTALRQAVLTHPSIFVNETLSHINPNFLPAHLHTAEAERNPELDAVIHKFAPSFE